MITGTSRELRIGLHLLEHAHPVELGHDDVEQHDIGTASRAELERVRPFSAVVTSWPVGLERAGRAPSGSRGRRRRPGSSRRRRGHAARLRSRSSTSAARPLPCVPGLTDERAAPQRARRRARAPRASRQTPSSATAPNVAAFDFSVCAARPTSAASPAPRPDSSSASRSGASSRNASTISASASVVVAQQVEKRRDGGGIERRLGDVVGRHRRTPPTLRAAKQRSKVLRRTPILLRPASRRELHVALRPAREMLELPGRAVGAEQAELRRVVRPRIVDPVSRPAVPQHAAHTPALDARREPLPGEVSNRIVERHSASLPKLGARNIGRTGSRDTPQWLASIEGRALRVRLHSASRLEIVSRSSKLASSRGRLACSKRCLTPQVSDTRSIGCASERPRWVAATSRVTRSRGRERRAESPRADPCRTR